MGVLGGCVLYLCWFKSLSLRSEMCLGEKEVEVGGGWWEEMKGKEERS